MDTETERGGDTELAKWALLAAGRSALKHGAYAAAEKQLVACADLFFAEEGADFSQWTRPDDIAAEIGMWMERPYARPHSGSLIKVFPNAKTGEGAVFTLAR